jgi:hypothetical protein
VSKNLLRAPVNVASFKCFFAVLNIVSAITFNSPILVLVAFFIDL